MSGADGSNVPVLESVGDCRTGRAAEFSYPNGRSCSIAADAKSIVAPKRSLPECRTSPSMMVDLQAKVAQALEDFMIKIKKGKAFYFEISFTRLGMSERAETRQ